MVHFSVVGPTDPNRKLRCFRPLSRFSWRSLACCGSIGRRRQSRTSFGEGQPAIYFRGALRGQDNAAKCTTRAANYSGAATEAAAAVSNAARPINAYPAAEIAATRCPIDRTYAILAHSADGLAATRFITATRAS